MVSLLSTNLFLSWSKDHGLSPSRASKRLLIKVRYNWGWDVEIMLMILHKLIINFSSSGTRNFNSSDMILIDIGPPRPRRAQSRSVNKLSVRENNARAEVICATHAQTTARAAICQKSNLTILYFKIVEHIKFEGVYSRF